MREFKRGDIIFDAGIINDQSRYLILKERENSFYCLDLTDLEPISIGKLWIDQYKIIESIDINKVIGFLKEN